MPVRLTADASDLASTFVLYDPDALEGLPLEDLPEDLDLARARQLAERGIAVHHADEGNASPDNPGTERRVAFLYLDDEPLSEEHEARAVEKVAASRLRVPSGTLYFASLAALRRGGTPARAGEAFDTVTIPPGDYHLSISMVGWARGEQKAFIAERTRPADHTAEHLVGCLGFFTLASTVLVPIALLVLYVITPWASGEVPGAGYAVGLVSALGALWLVLFALSRAPSQRRLIAARHAVTAKSYPSPIYRLRREPPGDAPAFVDERD